MRDLEKKRKSEAIYYQKNRERKDAYARKWREEHPERILELGRLSSARWREKNREKYLAAKRAYNAMHRERLNKEAADFRKKNPEKHKEAFARWLAKDGKREIKKMSTKAWRKANPEIARARNALRKALKRSAPGRFSGEDVKRLLASQKGRCVVCRADISRKYHIDHVLPLVLGGTNDRTTSSCFARRVTKERKRSIRLHLCKSAASSYDLAPPLAQSHRAPTPRGARRHLRPAATAELLPGPSPAWILPRLLLAQPRKAQTVPRGEAARVPEGCLQMLTGRIGVRCNWRGKLIVQVLREWPGVPGITPGGTEWEDATIMTLVRAMEIAKAIRIAKERDEWERAYKEAMRPPSWCHS